MSSKEEVREAWIGVVGLLLHLWSQRDFEDDKR